MVQTELEALQEIQKRTEADEVRLEVVYEMVGGFKCEFYALTAKKLVDGKDLFVRELVEPENFAEYIAGDDMVKSFGLAFKRVSS